MAEFRYRAFISYSWADAKWGNWLHAALERYRPPGGLATVGEAATRRLRPIFKDREEQAAGAAIGAIIERALGDSEFLIVVCSRNSARSEWVNREIAWFKTHRTPDKVLAFIVDGEPGSSEDECFPAALTHAVSADLAIGERLADEPLAADARKQGDGRQRAMLKLAAAMLGVGLDDLVRRDAARRTRRLAWLAAASLAGMALAIGLALFAFQQREQAIYQREQADSLIEFMLTDLREKLEPVGRLDALDVVGARALAYYAGQSPGSLQADALGRRARALLLVGEISNLRGDSEAALRAFGEAASSTAEQLARDPGNGQRLFDHAQSVFWVGAVAYSRGELQQAEARFREYQRLAARLVELDPGKPEWQLESSYAETNLGVLLFEQGRYAEAEATLATGLERIEAVVAGEDFDAGRQLELGQTLNWYAMASGAQGKIAAALALHDREVALYEDILRRDPANSSARYRLAVAQQFVGEGQLDSGRLEMAMAAYGQSLALVSELRALEPENAEWQETEVHGKLAQAENLIYAGHLDSSAGLLDEARELLAAMIAADPSNTIWSRDIRANQEKIGASLALASGDLRAAERNAAAAIGLYDQAAGQAGSIQPGAARRLAGDVQQGLRQAARARALWQEGLERLPQNPAADAERYLLLKRLGRTTEAAEVAARLDRRGYRHPAYRRER